MAERLPLAADPRIRVSSLLNGGEGRQPLQALEETLRIDKAGRENIASNIQRLPPQSHREWW